MKQVKNISQGLAGAIFCLLGLLLLGSLFGSCSPKITLQTPRPWEDEPPSLSVGPEYSDTQYVIRFQRPISGEIVEMPLDSLLGEKLVVDTLFLPGETIAVTDTFPCPPGLPDTVSYTFTRTVYVPAKAVPLAVPPIDTVILTKTKAVQGKATFSDMSWGERITWLLGVIGLLVALWNGRKGGGKVAAA